MRTIRQWLLIALAGAVCAGCPKPLPTPNPPGPDADASTGVCVATMPPGPPSCATACARGCQLGCPWARPTLNGASCETVCANANRVDGPLRWDLRCRTNIGTCPAADLCP